MPVCLAGAQLWGHFSGFCALFQTEGLQSKFATEWNCALWWQLSSYSPRYGLFVFIFVLLSHSAVSGPYFRCRYARWALRLFSYFCCARALLKCRLICGKSNDVYDDFDAVHVSRVCWTFSYGFYLQCPNLVIKCIHPQFGLKFISVLYDIFFVFTILFYNHGNSP